MKSFEFIVAVCAVLVLIFSVDNEVTAAPHPCLWMMGPKKTSESPDTTTSSTGTGTTPTPKPDLIEKFAKLKQEKADQLKDLFTKWLSWGSHIENLKSYSLEKLVSKYIKFLKRLFMKF